MPFLSIQNLWKSFDGRRVLCDLSFDVERGESLVQYARVGSRMLKRDDQEACARDLVQDYRRTLARSAEAPR